MLGLAVRTVQPHDVLCNNFCGSPRLSPTSFVLQGAEWLAGLAQTRLTFRRRGWRYVNPVQTVGPSAVQVDSPEHDRLEVLKVAVHPGL